MSTNRPINAAFPLGLFCNASWSLAPQKSDAEPEPLSNPLPLDRELLDMPAVAPGSGTDGLEEDTYSDEEARLKS